MKWTRVAAAALAASAPVAVFVALSCAPQPKTAAQAMDPDAKIKRGEYLTKASACIDCHTPGTLFGDPHFDRNLSGSELGWQGPWGVTFARNLTPDRETGIAAWSDTQIVNAFRTGTRPDGSVLRPPMPWPAYSVMTDDDAYAIAAYLKSLPPVHHKVPDALPPGSKAKGSIIVWPAPSAWDAPTPKADSTAGGAGGGAGH